MKLRVLRYDEMYDDYVCSGVDAPAWPGHHSSEVRVDLIVDGGISDIIATDRQAIVGKTVEVDYIFPVSFLAQNVRMVDTGSEQQKGGG